jgi:hypothetical protein
MCSLEEIDSFLGHTSFSKLREYLRDAVDVSVGARDRHGLNGNGDIESALMRVACGRLDIDASGDAGDHDLSDTELLQMFFQTRVSERSPRPLRHRIVFRLTGSARGRDRPIRRAAQLSTAASLFRSTRCSAGDVDEHDRQTVVAKRVSQRDRVLHDLADSVCGGQSEDAFLQVDDTECGLRVKGGYCHGFVLLVIWAEPEIGHSEAISVRT